MQTTHNTISPTVNVNAFAETEKFLQENNIILYTTKDISLSDAEFLADITQQEDKLETKTAEQILNNTKNGLSLILKQYTNIIGCIFLRQYIEPYHGNTLYERGTLWVEPAFRSKGIAEYLRHKLDTVTHHMPIISITSNPKIKQKNLSAGMFEYDQSTIQQDNALRNVLTEDDLDPKYGYRYYTNPTLESLRKQYTDILHTVLEQ